MSLLRTAGRVAVASSVHGKVQRRQQQRWSAADQAAQAQAAAPVAVPVAVPVAAPPAAVPAPAPAPVLDDVDEVTRRIELLRQLGELHAAGVLTAEEFAAQKARVLG